MITEDRDSSVPYPRPSHRVGDLYVDPILITHRGAHVPLPPVADGAGSPLKKIFYFSLRKNRCLFTII